LIKIVYGKTDGEYLVDLERQINELEQSSREFAIISSVVDESGYLLILVRYLPKEA